MIHEIQVQVNAYKTEDGFIDKVCIYIRKESTLRKKGITYSFSIEAPKGQNLSAGAIYNISKDLLIEDYGFENRLKGSEYLYYDIFRVFVGLPEIKNHAKNPREFMSLAECALAIEKIFELVTGASQENSEVFTHNGVYRVMSSFPSSYCAGAYFPKTLKSNQPGDLCE